MATGRTYDHYEVEIGWYETTAVNVLQDTVLGELLSILQDDIDTGISSSLQDLKDSLVYENGELYWDTS
jgi:hypothetical protein